MSKTGTQSRAGEDASPVAEVKNAVSGFVSEFKSFQADIQQRIEKQEEQMTKMERKSAGLKRPVLAAADTGAAAH